MNCKNVISPLVPRAGSWGSTVGCKAGLFIYLIGLVEQGFSNPLVSRKVGQDLGRTKSLGCSYICVSMKHTVQSRAARYTNINHELWYCLVRFLNHKGRDLKHCVCFETRARTTFYNRDVSEWQFIKCSVHIIDEKKLAHFTALCSAWDYINLKIQMLRKLFQVCSFSSISSGWTRQARSIFPRYTVYF